MEGTKAYIPSRSRQLGVTKQRPPQATTLRQSQDEGRGCEQWKRRAVPYCMLYSWVRGKRGMPAATPLVSSRSQVVRLVCRGDRVSAQVRLIGTRRRYALSADLSATPIMFLRRDPWRPDGRAYESNGRWEQGCEKPKLFHGRGGVRGTGQRVRMAFGAGYGGRRAEVGCGRGRLLLRAE